MSNYAEQLQKAEGFLREALEARDLSTRAALLGKATYWHRKALEMAGLVPGPRNPPGARFPDPDGKRYR